MAVLRDVGLSLKKLLQQKITELSQENSIIFESPADIEPTANPRLSIFLYQVAENTYLRNTGSDAVSTDRMRYPPLTLDLHYIFTPYHQNREIELIILERLIQVFHDNPVIRDAMLEGSLKDSGNDEIRIVSNNLKLEEISELWERFPNKAFKISISYILTPVRIPSEKEPVKITKVKEKDIRVHVTEAIK